MPRIFNINGKTSLFSSPSDVDMKTIHAVTNTKLRYLLDLLHKPVYLLSISLSSISIICHLIDLDNNFIIIRATA